MTNPIKLRTGMLAFLLIATSCVSSPGTQSQVELRAQAQHVTVDTKSVMAALLAEEDIDGDKKITIEDQHKAGKTTDGRGDGVFTFETKTGEKIKVESAYRLANLLQELALAADHGNTIDLAHVEEPPVDHLSRQIRELYWKGLTRRVDARSINEIVRDDKMTSEGAAYVWVPHDDERAYRYFKAALMKNEGMRVERLPKVAEIDAKFMKSIEKRHGILSLDLICDENDCTGRPFVVPGGRFNEMYGWDSYFIGIGLIHDGLVSLARDMVENQVYQIEHYGKILNANRTYYLTRSQPPFLAALIRATYEALPKTKESKEWLRRMLKAVIKEHETVWTTGLRLTKTGLSRYHDIGQGASPETEPGHFDAVYRPYAAERKMSVREFETLYRAGKLSVPKLDRYFVHDRAMRESGHDTTYRWDGKDTGCADFVTVDLNSLLFRMETDIAHLIKSEFADQFPDAPKEQRSSRWWMDQAKKRRDLMMRYLWDDERGLFFDYNVAKGQRSQYLAATTLYPLWASDPHDPAASLVTPKQAERLVKAALAELEVAGGVVASAEKSRGPLSDTRPPRQWDYPYGWAPHQIMSWTGLAKHGFKKEAERLAYRWLFTITRNAVDYNGTVPEKFDLVTRSHAVFAEYGNVGTKFSYITREGFGWTNASYQLGLDVLGPELRKKLNDLETPETVFPKNGAK